MDMLEQELTALCAELVATPSVNGVHGERGVAERIARWATERGLWADVCGDDPARPNVVVRAPDASDEAGLLLLAHTDTVVAGDLSRWTYDPWSATIRDGKLYGRGAIDNKGGATAALGALLMLRERDPAAFRKTTFVGVPDEENGATGTLGVRYLHRHGLLRGLGAIYTYPGMERLVVGHRGVLRLTLMAHGEAMHTGSLVWQNAPRGSNAVTGLSEVVLVCERLRFDTPSQGLFAELETVVTPTMMHGGDGPSMVPSLCHAHIDVRLVAGVSRDAVLAAIERIIAEVTARRPPLRVELTVDAAIPTTEVAPDAAIVRGIHAATGDILGTTPALKISGPANESYILNELGIPTCVLGPDGDNAHAADEYVVLASLPRAAEVYARTAQYIIGRG